MLFRVLILNIIACGVFHTLLLLVPHNTVTITYPTATAYLGIPGAEHFCSLSKGFIFCELG
jgi:hypothetical protein